MILFILSDPYIKRLVLEKYLNIHVYSTVNEAKSVLESNVFDCIIYQPYNDKTVFKQIEYLKSVSKAPLIIVDDTNDLDTIKMYFKFGVYDVYNNLMSFDHIIWKINAMLNYLFTSRKIYEKQGLVINFNKFEISYLDYTAKLTKNEATILQLLINNKNKVITRTDISRAVYGFDYNTYWSINMTIASIRKKMGQYSYFIQTMSGLGYIFNDEAE